ncbi:hypothetical protein SAMN05421839_13013 [Halolactibacillus halophilus]|uniref:Permease n=1 Tax=Halolactibacillus halophilus TaxID=306540 RepID=A0A1I5RGW9_9BACI|nr:AEC family transporter [Halolactibacillus halophilus]GEM02353.1 hypothetical protein HHA03_18850 [Halolactibacillus halophilus]SFP57824.1 hypothetical protein SAMN05421839_13013 [Halolactibacillus halophilus]
MYIAVSKIIPILILISFGFIINLKFKVPHDFISMLRKAIVSIALPAVLFTTFLDMEIKSEFLPLSLTVVLMFSFMYIAGFLLSKYRWFNTNLTPFFLTATGFGTIGIVLFLAMFGNDALFNFTVFGIGHEFFAWFIYIPMIHNYFNKQKFSMNVIKDFIKSPIILTIFLGVILNISGFSNAIVNSPLNFIWQGILETFNLLGNVITPVLLMIIGATLSLEKIYIKEALRLVILRLTVMLSIGYLFKILVFNNIVESSPLFNFAYFTLLILPPPYSSMVFIGEYESDENLSILSNGLAISTIVCLVIFIIAGIFHMSF